MQRLSARARILLVLAVALVVRLLLIGNAGFSIDVGDFEAWATQVTGAPLASFYNGAGFADYPPGYLYVLMAVGRIYHMLAPDGNGGLFLALVKLPAILADLGCAALLYAIVRRYASETWALGAAAIFAFNPAAIVVSAAWGQVDSVSGGLALLAIYLMLRSRDGDERAGSLTIGAWLALAASVLVKPQAAVLAPLFAAVPFAALFDGGGAARLRRGLIHTAGGIVAAFALALLASAPFHPSGNPVDVLTWLAGIYGKGYGGYAVNSANAFDLWTIARPFWQSDGAILLGLAQHVWGVALFLAALALIVWRWLQTRTEEAFVEASALAAFAFFILMTRMHERYVFDALLFLCATIPLARRYLVATVVVSLTTLANLFYSLRYLEVVQGHVPGANAFDLWGASDHVLSFVNVAAFFALTYVYLSREATATFALPKFSFGKAAAEGDPAEGTRGMLWPLDYVVSGVITLGSFVLLYINYWLPTDKIFDEIYFARAAEEYLSRNYIYENTHPPVTKLLIEFSTWMWGGLARGDTSFGWRFLDVVAGALVVWVIYVFARRLTASTLFAAFAALMLALDGQHFVQSRIATPEAFVALFALCATYAFYRFWIATSEREPVPIPEDRIARTIAYRWYATGAAVLLSAGAVLLRFPQESFATKIVIGAYVVAGLYLVYRLALEGRIFGRSSKPHAADLWLALFAVFAALLVTSKWYGVMIYGAALGILALVNIARTFDPDAAPWGDPRAFRLDVVFCSVLFALGTVYALAYVPHFIGLRDLPYQQPRPYTATDVVNMQISAYDYHRNLKATHPYQSVWWQWPLDLRPVLYSAKYAGAGPTATAGMIYTLPNPIVLWFGLFAVPFVGVLAWREKRKGYALVVVAYLAQWLPWIYSPRIAWNYHFYVNVALICLCNAIALQWLWRRGWKIPVAIYMAGVFAAFAFFYPILAGVQIPLWAWHLRQWFPSWV